MTAGDGALRMRQGSGSHPSPTAAGGDEEAAVPAAPPADDPQPHGLGEDRPAVALLLLLYTLQGIPMGLAGSIPMLIQDSVTFKQQAVFALVSWPYSLKLLWAPIVDTWRVRGFGRRKSWLVPVQLAVGALMLLLAARTDAWLAGEPNIPALTAAFLALYFLVATQDIAVDGWALTILSPRNVGWASSCNAVGQTVGYFTSFTAFLALNSADFCNSYLRGADAQSAEGMVSLADFLSLWGWIFIVTTLLVAFLRPEAETAAAESVGHAYATLWRITQMRNVRWLMLVLVTCRMGFAAADTATGLKLLERGMPREHLAGLGVAVVPLELALPVVLARFVAGARPLSAWMHVYPLRLLGSLAMVGVVWLAPPVGGEFSTGYYALLFAVFLVYRTLCSAMFTAQMAFFARVSDPTVGGTYMTLLNTLANLGNMWTGPLALWLLDASTYRYCDLPGAPEAFLRSDAARAGQGLHDACMRSLHDNECTEASGACVTLVEGYYVLAGCCFVVGALWYAFMSSRVRGLQAAKVSSWRFS